METLLKDPHGRHIHKLRLGLLDACNLRCRYCMPQSPKFLPSKELLTREEILAITKNLVDLGIDEIRLTGGEPTMRHDFINIVEDLSSLPLKKLALTTNGLFLKPLLPRLKKTKCHYINFSLDGLSKQVFKDMTGSNKFTETIEAILLAKEFGLNVKVNVVLMKGINDKDIERFVDFSALHNIEVRFLELMRIGPAREKFDQYFMSADELMERLTLLSTLTPIQQSKDSTSFNFRLENGANIGIIASESKPFCASCSRLRLSPKGTIRPCLMMDEGFSLKNKTMAETEMLLNKTMGLKPMDRIYEVNQPMNQIGG
jgi:GTP 3',8-cyclase